MLVLDTNHLREYVNASALGSRLRDRMDESLADAFTCIVAVEESMQGWLALLHRTAPGPEQIRIYARFQNDIGAMSKLVILPFDEDAATMFLILRKEHPRAGTMDMKIAAICLVHDATLLTRNLTDFKNIPDLRMENWLD